MSTFKATDWDGQTLHAATVEELGERTPGFGTASTLWDIHELDSDRQTGPRYVGYMVGGVLQPVEPEGVAGDGCGNCGTTTATTTVKDWRTERMCGPCVASFDWADWNHDPATGTYTRKSPAEMAQDRAGQDERAALGQGLPARPIARVDGEDLTRHATRHVAAEEDRRVHDVVHRDHALER